MPNQYTLGHTEAEYFTGFESAGEVLDEVAVWVNQKPDRTVLAVNLNFDLETNEHGATVLWER